MGLPFPPPTAGPPGDTPADPGRPGGQVQWTRSVSIQQGTSAVVVS